MPEKANRNEDRIAQQFPLQRQHIADNAIGADHLDSTLARMTGEPTGRLTLTTATPVTTSDVTSASTIYYTPYEGNTVALYDGTSWQPYTFTERSLALSSLTSGKNYDVFLYDNAGTLTLELSAAWTNDTTRADAITLQDGVYVKSGATTRRYLGTIRTTGTTTTEDSRAKRYVWNAYNRKRRACAGPKETTDSWVYTTAAWRQARATSSNRFEYVAGLSEDAVEAVVKGLASNASAVNLVAVGVGIDSTTVNSAETGGGYCAVNFVDQFDAQYRGQPGLGYHAVNWLEYSYTFGTQNWYGDAAFPEFQSGIVGTVFA